MKANRGPPAPRTTTGLAGQTKSSESFEALRFDFAERPRASGASASVLPRSFDGVKRAILRWLEKEL